VSDVPGRRVRGPLKDAIILSNRRGVLDIFFIRIRLALKQFMVRVGVGVGVASSYTPSLVRRDIFIRCLSMVVSLQAISFGDRVTRLGIAPYLLSAAKPLILNRWLSGGICGISES